MREDDTRAAGESYQAAIASPIRTDQDRRMDAARHPAEFLPFTQAKPGMNVLDVSTEAVTHRSCWHSWSDRVGSCGRRRNNPVRR